MNPQIEDAANRRIAEIFGGNLRLTPEIANAMRMMYGFGRGDILADLGLEEDDFPPQNGMVAWSA